MCPAAVNRVISCLPLPPQPASYREILIARRNPVTRYQQRSACLSLASPEAMGKAIVPLRSNAQSLAEDTTHFFERHLVREDPPSLTADSAKCDHLRVFTTITLKCSAEGPTSRIA